MTVSAHRCSCVALALEVFFGANRLAAQQTADTDAATGLRLGGLSLTRTIEFNSGIDTNVFNSSAEPTSDFTWTLTPRTEAAFRLGRARVTGRGSADFVYFQQSSTERSINLDGSVKLTAPFNRVRPFVSSSFVKTRQRPSFEIDARSLRHERSLSAGTAVRVSGKTDFEVAATTTDTAFDPSAVFVDTYLREVFNRTTRTLSLSARHALTPLTTVTMTVDSMGEQFALSPVRNSRSIRVAPGFEFASTALISGKASVGYRSFDAKDASVPDFKGAVASVELAYTLAGTARFLVQANRDVQYSYEATAPYYVLSSLGGGIIERITDSMGITARGARYRFSYRSIAPDVLDGSSRPDDTMTLESGGVLYKIGRDLRISVNVDHYSRVSPLLLRKFSSIRGGTSIVYGF